MLKVVFCNYQFQPFKGIASVLQLISIQVGSGVVRRNSGAHLTKT